MMRYSLPIANIDKIDLCIIGIKEYFICFEIHFTYLVHPHFVFYLGQKYFNKLKNVLCIEKPVIDQQIIPNKSKMT